MHVPHQRARPRPTSRSARSPHCSHGRGSRLAMTCSSNAGRAVHERCVAAQSATRDDSAASRTRRAGVAASRTRSEGEACSYVARDRGTFARRARRECSKAVPSGARAWNCAVRARGRYSARAPAASPTRFRIAPRLCAADTYAGVSERECKHGLVCRARLGLEPRRVVRDARRTRCSAAGRRIAQRAARRGGEPAGGDAAVVVRLVVRGRRGCRGGVRRARALTVERRHRTVRRDEREAEAVGAVVLAVRQVGYTLVLAISRSAARRPRARLRALTRRRDTRARRAAQSTRRCARRPRPRGTPRGGCDRARCGGAMSFRTAHSSLPRSSRRSPRLPPRASSLLRAAVASAAAAAARERGARSSSFLVPTLGVFGADHV